MRTIVICVAAAVVLSISACDRNEADPLRALRSSEPLIASSYGPDFWHDQYRKNTQLWRDALDYCNRPDRRHTQNCEILLSLTQEPPALSSTPLPYVTSPIPSGLRAGVPAPKAAASSPR